MRNVLIVFWAETRVGELALEADRKMRFTYTADWLRHRDAMPLSCSLPVRVEPFEDALARPFFANLLPEADIRRLLSQELGLSRGNDFGLLDAIGGECAGAISIWRDGQTPPTTGSYDPLTDAQLDSMIQAIPERPFLAGPLGATGYRLSLAGAQPKIPVHVSDGHISLPKGAYSSTHIIKPPITSLTHSVYNEAYCMTLADRLKLGVPSYTILQGKAPSFCIQRYDRQRVGEKVLRLHQEDFCQVFSVPPEAKYEIEGGPGLKRCFEAIAQWSVNPAVDRYRLLQWTVFNQLIGNADAHAKNISFLYQDNQIRLAPFYDLLSTRFYPRLSDQAAMAIGGQRAIDLVNRRNWEVLAEEVEIKPKLVLSLVTDFAEAIQEFGDVVEKEVKSRFPSRYKFPELKSDLRKRCAKSLRALKKR